MRRCFSLGKTLAAHLKAAGPVVGLDNCKCKVHVAAVEFVTDFADAHTGTQSSMPCWDVSRVIMSFIASE